MILWTQYGKRRYVLKNMSFQEGEKVQIDLYYDFS